MDDVKVVLLESDGKADYYTADVRSYSNYYAFGMQQPGRNYVSAFGKHRYGFNGKERDTEWNKGAIYDYGFRIYDFDARIYDSRLGLFLSIDPLVRKYPFQSPYSAFNLNPIIFVDPSGMGGDYYAEYQKNAETGKTELVITDYVDTGEESANRLFIKDPNANSKTENRMEHNGGYYQMEMIPTGWYSEEEKGFSGLQNQYDKDRYEYTQGSGGDYSDKDFLDRMWEDLSDSDFLEQGSDIVLRGAGKVSGLLGIRKFFQKPGSRPGQDFTKAGKREVWKDNTDKNNGKNACTTCGTDVVKPEQSQKGVVPPKNEGHVDHINKKKDGGSGDPSNGRIRCRDCNTKDNQ